MAKGRIRAVDDQRYFRELLEGLLTDAGYDVVTAGSGEEALRILEQSDFDVILTDLVMPGMDGNDLVHRAKERDPEQEIVVVTGVVDVKTAVDAMKLGASEYLIKPFDRTTLTRALDKILQGRRLRAEHARLLAENIEYMGERSLFERAASLFSCLGIDPLAARIAESLCVETRAQSGVVWIADEDHPDRLQLAVVRGLVHVNEEPEILEATAIPEVLRDGSCGSAIVNRCDVEGERHPALYFRLDQGDRLAGLIRLSDKLGDDAFDSMDQAWGEKFLEFAEIALTNARRFARLEQQTLADPRTGAFTVEYFEGAVRSEIEKANRFGRQFAVVSVDCPGAIGADPHDSDSGVASAIEVLVAKLKGVMRSADLLATDGNGRFWILLPETDALGGAVFKRRIEEGFESEASAGAADVAEALSVELTMASYPADGTQLESLWRVLDERRAERQASPVHRLGLLVLSLEDGLAALAESGVEESPEVSESILRFLLAEVARRPGDRGLVVLSPGAALWTATQEGLSRLATADPKTSIFVISERRAPVGLPKSVTWLVREGAPLPPFVVRYGERSVYALVRDEKSDPNGARMYHTQDRGVVEFLTFRLQREFALPELF